MKILWVTSEAIPYAKTGGLADVSGALPEALAKRGHQVTVFMPYYRQQMGKLNLRFDSRLDLIGVPFGPNMEWAGVNILKANENLTFMFLEYDRFFDRPRLYDWDGREYGDNAERFAFFCRAAMEVAVLRKLNPDILHVNDWHAALCSVYLKSDYYRTLPAFQNCRSVLTIHNIGYQGIFPKDKLYWTGLGWDYFNYTCLEFHDCINYLHGGIMTSDMVNAVSPTYASEILSPEYGFGLDASLRHVAARGRLRGILNGIDVDEWDPAKDKTLPAMFTPDDLAGKAVCKKALQEQFGLKQDPDVPLFATISRFAEQKGLDVFARGLEYLAQNFDMQFVVIGSGDMYLENWFRYLAGKYPGRIGVYIGYASQATAHLAEAGADFFVMPSRYEPCGLNQMYSMRYGTLPVVRSTGGLADTVINLADDKAPATGFVFWDLNSMALNNTITWAANVRKSKPAVFRKMIRRAMTTDFSWKRTAGNYERLYEDAHQ